MGELGVEHPAVGFDQAESVELSLVALIVERAEVSPSRSRSARRARAPCARRLERESGDIASGNRDARLPTFCGSRARPGRRGIGTNFSPVIIPLSLTLTGGLAAKLASNNDNSDHSSGNSGSECPSLILSRSCV